MVSMVETMCSKLEESGLTACVRQRISVTERKALGEASSAPSPDAGTWNAPSSFSAQ